MINDTFYSLLEYKICDALESTSNEQGRYFWCDGVTPGFENEYSLKHVNDKRKIVMTAYIGETGQDIYELILNFGKKALSRYARGLDISVCIPESPDGEWFTIDLSKRQAWVQLD